MSVNKIQIAEYLEALDPQASVNYCNLMGISVLDVLPFTFESGEQVYTCLGSFLEEGVPLQYLFNSAEVWGMYLKGITEERYHSAIDLMLSTGNPADIIMYFRACYRFGFPAIDDKSSDVLEELYANTYPALHYIVEQSYDDDEYPTIVMDAIKMSGVRNSGKSASTAIQSMNLEGNPAYTELNADKSKSIRPVIDEKEAFDFWRNAPMCRVHFSLKIDGVNTKMLYGDKDSEGLVLALSRGRASDSIDYTEAIRRVLSTQGIDAAKLAGRVTGESYVPLDMLPTIQSLYPGKDYKTPKSTAMAMLRAPDKFREEDYQYLHFSAFDYEGYRVDEAFRLLEDAKMKVPPYVEIAGEDIPRDSLEHFNEWMETNVLTPLWEEGQHRGVGSDGVVMYLLADINTERKDHYSDSNIAIKYSHWAAANYRSVVTDIIFEQRRVEASIVLQIEPVVMRDSNTATRVGVGSPDILIKDGVRVGDTIEFTRKSEAYNVYLRKV